MNYKESDHTFVLCAYKDSPYIDECLESLFDQSCHSRIIVATSTPSEAINALVKKYDVPLRINRKCKGIGSDWNFALSCAKTSLVTIAHQDDIYTKTYVGEMLETINGCRCKPQIFFSDYGEIRNGKFVEDTKLLRTKRRLLRSLSAKRYASSRHDKRNAIRLGSAICCPSVTYNMDVVPLDFFSTSLKCDLDWDAWERLSNISGSFCYSPKILMYHRIHIDSETSRSIENNIRTEEDYLMLQKFWPMPIAKLIGYFYRRGQDSNF